MCVLFISFVEILGNLSEDIFPMDSLRSCLFRFAFHYASFLKLQVGKRKKRKRKRNE